MLMAQTTGLGAPRGFCLDSVHAMYNTSGAEALAGVSLAIEPGEFVAVVGPNGAGKSTLLQVLAGLVEPSRGTVTLDGIALRDHRRRDLARRIAWLPQRLDPAFDITVADLVGLGRTAHRPLWGGNDGADRRAIDGALAATDTTEFRDRLVQELSGGERQRVALAMSFAQAPQVLLLDEPTTHLDPAPAQGLLDVVARKHRDDGLTVVAVFHDLNLAALAAGRVVVIDRGQVIADGPPAVALAPPVLARTFGPVMHTVTHPIVGVDQVLPARAPTSLHVLEASR
jgi:iron complex transport system ATP-binding protein